MPYRPNLLDHHHSLGYTRSSSGPICLWSWGNGWKLQVILGPLHGLFRLSDDLASPRTSYVTPQHFLTSSPSLGDVTHRLL